MHIAGPPTKGCTTNTHGFVVATGNLKLIAGYATYPSGVFLLYMFEQIGNQPPTIWRNFLCGKEHVMEAAIGLCADAQEYIDSIGPARPYEDLGLEDFLQHLKARIENGLC